MKNQFTLTLDGPVKRDDYNKIDLSDVKAYNLENLYEKFEEMISEEASNFVGDVVRINNKLRLHRHRGPVHAEIKLLNSTFTSVEVTLKGDEKFASTLKKAEKEQFIHVLQMMLEDYGKAFYSKAIELGFIKEERI